MMEWKEYKLGDLCDVSIGRTPPRNEFKWFNQDSHSYKWVSIKDMGKSTKYLYNTSETITFEGQKEFNIPIVPNNTVILSFKLTLGRVAITGNEDMLTNEAIAQLPIKNERVLNIEYLYYYLKNFNYDTLGNTSSIATAVNSKTIKNLPVVVPPYEKQLVIVSILSEIDKKIECNNKTCTNLEAQAQALFKHWFIDFAPFKNGQFVESELGMIPEGWRVGRAEDFYTINIGKTPPRAERKWFSESRENNKIWISISDMGGCGAFISDSKEYLTPEAQSKFNIVMVPVGTVLLSFKLTLGRVAIADAELTTNEAIARFILPSFDYREYTYLYLKQFKYGRLGSTSSIATAVNSKIIKAMPFLMPPKEVIMDFSNIAGKLFDEIKSLNQESARLSTLRDTLLPKLMSGQIKV